MFLERTTGTWQQVPPFTLIVHKCIIEVDSEGVWLYGKTPDGDYVKKCIPVDICTRVIHQMGHPFILTKTTRNYKITRL